MTQTNETLNEFDARDDGYTIDDAYKALEIRLRYASEPLRRDQELEESPARGATFAELANVVGEAPAELRERFDSDGTLF